MPAKRELSSTLRNLKVRSPFKFSTAKLGLSNYTCNQESLETAEAMATSEVAAMAEAVARLDEAVAEKGRVLELLGTKEAETASASKKVAEFEGVVVKLEGKSTELHAERGELEKQLWEMQTYAFLVQTQKAEVEESFKGFNKNTEMYQQEM